MNPLLLNKPIHEEQDKTKSLYKLSKVLVLTQRVLTPISRSRLLAIEYVVDKF